MQGEAEDHIALQEKHHPERNESQTAGEGESCESHGMLYSSERHDFISFLQA
jgi:hypothetical protein